MSDTENIYTALLAFQKDAPQLVKSASGNFQNKFVPLEQLVEKVVPVLNKNGIILMQGLEFQGLRTTLHHAESGTQVTTVMPLMMEKQTPQGQGSAISYARRYALLSVLGLVGDKDDDASAAEKAWTPADSRGPSIPVAATPSL